MTSSKEQVRDVLDRLVTALRPKLQSYCASMTGSAIDGEDVVQEALLKAIQAAPRMDSLADPEAWLFRIAHNTTVDFLRRRTREASQLYQLEDETLEMLPDLVDEIAQRQAAAASLRIFMRLKTAERSSVILKDVLGYSLREVAETMGVTIPSVKAALHRGRTYLREFAQQPEDLPPPVMSEQERVLLTAYIDHFNARDFDAVRLMIAEDIRLELVGRGVMRGRAEVAPFLGKEAAARQGWSLSLCFIDRRPAILVCPPEEAVASRRYPVLLKFEGRRIAGIRDYRYAPDVLDEAEVIQTG
jgi:RNA polymerase sigma-70 factor (ECF subfamily)